MILTSVIVFVVAVALTVYGTVGALYTITKRRNNQYHAENKETSDSGKHIHA
jgi:hypothetical protein